ncbi:MAG: peptidoglycan DD-metalloendopeptidase family protein [Clostridiales bacterium]|nr:peptidoglycan DD-metalloendopeptidase family protein [Clostridiales bacterium]
MKKLFEDKKSSRRSFGEFFERRGFYFILILCVLIVGATAIYITSQNVNMPEEDYGADKFLPDEYSNIPEDDLSDGGLSYDGDTGVIGEEGDQAGPLTVPDEKAGLAGEGDGDAVAAGAGTGALVDQGAANNASGTGANASGINNSGAGAGTGTVAVNTGGSSGTSAVTPAKGTKTGTPAGSTKKDITATPTLQKFIFPVYGEYSFEYAVNKLVYSKTLEEWRTHSGVDIASDRGTPVKVVADGVVSEIKNDPRYGILVIITHTTSVSSVYANLAGDDMVVPNQKVKQGDIIGSVGNTAAFESAEKPHLHFEVLKNGEPVNPLDYLPSK